MASHYRDSLILVFTVVGNNCIVVDKNKHEQESLENIHQRYNILKKNNNLLEQLLTNKSLECDSSKNTTFQPKKELGSFSIKKKSCCDKNKATSKSVESNFLQSQVYPDYYWIGLSYDSGERKWKWTDDGTSE
uniref:Killer cell lectin-like receptor 3 n=1 Tax=Castor canadensis TaxID=51338 RepID=A0A8B7TT04_CASCN